MDDTERELLVAADSAGWTAKPTLKRKGLEAAALLDEEGRNERLPKNTELVGLVSSTPSVYGLLSVPAHGDRFGMRHAEHFGSEHGADGPRRMLVGGFGLPANVAIAMAVLAMDRTCRLIAGWNGVDATLIHAASGEIMRRAGIKLMPAVPSFNERAPDD